MLGPSQNHAAGATPGQKERPYQLEELLPRRLAPSHDPALAASVSPLPGPRITPERRIFLGRGQGRCARSQGLLSCWWLELLRVFQAGLCGEADSWSAAR